MPNCSHGNSVRYVSIDILRTFAIFLMVFVHFMENLAGAAWGFGGFAAPLFTFLVGVSYRLWLNAQEAKGVDDSEITKVSIRRGVFLFVVGVVFNVCVWLPDDLFNWDVLTLIGSALVVLTFVRNFPLLVPVLLATTVFVLGPVLREIVGYSEFWSEGYFDPYWTPPDVLLGYLATGYFPVCPWLVFPLAGFVTGTVFFSCEPGESPSTGRTALLGAVFLALAAAVVGMKYATPNLLDGQALQGWTMFPASVEYVTGSLGLSLLLFSLAHRWIDPRAQSFEKTRLHAVTSTFGKYSLSVYVLHHVMHLWPLWAYGALSGHEPTAFWRQALPVWVATLLAIVCLVLAYLLFRWMNRTGRGGLEGLMRRVCG